ncbi:uncharacterized protein LOC111252887 [Varroa destructor]|uniref:Mitochondrial ribosomal protein S34 n=1 Tax=Varroa destructor TaxID=109461 RepID=A0A7M7KI57_VARDE|nr:uncharacterized protein LOC111252887 [Varroa destructor]
MPRIQYIGNPSTLHGKHLMRILTNLKDFGIGRLVTRSLYDKYPEPSFYVIKKVHPYMDDENIWAKVWVDKYYRGTIGPRDMLLQKSMIPDYRLIPKEEEKALFDKITGKPRVQILPRQKEFPPLLKMVIERDLRARGIETTPKLPLVYNLDPLEPQRVAEEGEKPDYDPDTNESPLTVEKLRQGIQF